MLKSDETRSNGSGRMTNSTLQDTLNALKSVIESQQESAQRHEPTSTEYFALLSKTISIGAGGENMPNLLRVFLAVIPNSSQPVVQSQFKPVAGAMLKIVDANAADVSVTGLALDIIGAMLLKQECSEGFWALMPPLQSLNALLAFLDSEHSSLMKISHRHLLSLLQSHHHSKANAVRGYLADFSLGVMQSCTRSSYKRTHCLILLLERGLCHLPEQKLLQVMETMLHLQQIEVPKLTAAVYRAMDAFFQNPSFNCSDSMTLRTAELLLRSPPRTFDMEANTFYCTALSSSCLQVANRSTTQLLPFVTEVIRALGNMCESEFNEVHCAMGSALKRTFLLLFDKKILAKLIPSAATSAATADAAAPAAVALSAANRQLSGIIRQFIGLLQMRFINAWLYSLDAARSLFSVFKSNALPIALLEPLISKIAEMYQSVENGLISSIEAQLHIALAESLGAALRAVGVQNFLEIVPLKQQQQQQLEQQQQQQQRQRQEIEQPIPATREWIITLLHQNLKQMPCDIADFGKSILPLANEYYHTVKSLTNGSAAGVDVTATIRIMRTRITQLWSLLPEFCSNRVSDINESFPKLSGILERTFSDEEYPELVPFAVNTLHNLVKCTRSMYPQHATRSNTADSIPPPAAVAVLQSAAFKFLPLILQYIENISLGDSRFQDGVQCIATWSSFAPVALVEAISKKLMQLVLTSTAAGNPDAAEAAAAWMAVMMALIPQLPEALVVLLFKAVRPLLVAVDTSTVQKRSYSLLLSLLEHHRATVVSFESPLDIMKSICASLLTCHVSARTMRFKAMGVLMSDMDALDLKQVVDLVFRELLSCLKDSNKKSRDAAMDLLHFFIDCLTPEDLWEPLINALKEGGGEYSMDIDSESVITATKLSSVTQTRSAALTGLCLLIVSHRDHAELLQEAAVLLPEICSFGAMECPHLSRAMLAFIRVFVSTQPLQQLHQQLGVVLTAFTGTALGAGKAKYSSRCRAVMRKLCSRIGEETLRSHVPASDLPLLDYICRQARKSDRKKAVAARVSSRSKAERFLGSDSEDDEDEDDSDIDIDVDDNNATSVRAAGQPARSVLMNSIRSLAAERTKRTASSADYRLAARPKATRASESQRQTALPSSLDDLLEDQPPVLNMQRGLQTAGTSRVLNKDSQKVRAGNSSAVGSRAITRDADDDEYRYNVVVTKDGKVVVMELEQDTASLNTSKGRTSAADEAATTEEAFQQGGPNDLQQLGRFQNADANQSKKRKFNLREPGAEYRSKKAGGDVWKKGMMEPYAYIPLDPRLLSKRHKAEAVDHFGKVVRNDNKSAAAKRSAGRGRTGSQQARKKR